MNVGVPFILATRETPSMLKPMLQNVIVSFSSWFVIVLQYFCFIRTFELFLFVSIEFDLILV